MSHLVLDLELPRNDAAAFTVRDYLSRLLLKVWLEGEEFSGKRPFGNSGWEYDLIDPIKSAGLADNDDDAREMIVDAIKALSVDVI